MSVIEVDHLQKRYGETVAVANVSFSIEEGEIFGILGPNGAGKTTTVESIAGLREPDAGTIRVMGLDPLADRDELRQLLAIQLQETQQPDKLQVGEALELHASFYERPADPGTLLDALGLTDKRNTRFAKLSGGQKQRLSIALALIGNPRIAVLDELTTGLDPQARRDTWALIEGIRERGVTIVLVTHFMEEAERLCDRVALIDSGRVIAVDTPAGLTDTAAPKQVIRFRPSRPLPEGLFDGVPGVNGVAYAGDQVVVTGTGEVLAAVVSVLASHGIVANHLRMEQASLEDAFVALTRKERSR